MLGGGGRKGILVKQTPQIQRHIITTQSNQGGKGGREMERSGEGVVVGSGGTEEEEEHHNSTSTTTSEKHNNQKTIIDTIMLKYRPIAPKPVGCGGGSSPATSADSKNNSVAGLVKRKRKYVRVANRKSTAAAPAGKDKVKDQKGKDPASAISAAPDPQQQQQLGTTSKSVAEVNGSQQQQKQLLYEFLPEISTTHQKSAGISARNFSTVSHDSSSSFPTDNSPILTTEDDEARASRSTSGGGDMGGSTGSISVLSADLSTTEMMKRKKQQRQGKEAVVVQSWVTVERLTDACMDTGAVGAAGLGSTDFERKKNLEQDTCPGFISDALNQVPWTNLAYRKMVIGPRSNDHRREQLHHWLRLPVDQEKEQEHDKEEEDEDDVVVLLVEKERLPIMYPAFACLVRLQYYNHMTCCTTMDRRHKKDNKCCLTTMTVPCDVWRMDRGGFAWRLDVKAALTL